MTSLQEVLIALLLEFNEACTDLGIEYACADRLAWDAVKFHKFHDKTYDAYLMMQSAGFERLSTLLETFPSRIIEYYMVGSSRFFRYVASDTTLIDLDLPSYFNHPGIALTIQLLDAPDSEGLVSYQIDDDVLHFSVDTFFPVKQVSFEGHSLPVPADVDSYFTELVSPEWCKKKYTRSIRREKFPVIVDTEYGYHKLLEQPLVQDILDPAKQNQRQHYLQQEAALKHIIDKPNAYSCAVHLTYWRFQFWEEYYPRLSQIEAYLMSGNLEALERILSPCLKMLEFFAKRGLGLYFDPIVHQALAAVSKEKYGEPFVKKWISTIPSPHYESVAQVLLRHKVKHPLFDSEFLQLGNWCDNHSSKTRKSSHANKVLRAKKTLLREDNIKNIILIHYGIEVGAIEEIVKGSRSSTFKISCINSGKLYFLKEPLAKTSKRTVVAEAELLRHLKQDGIPVAEFVKTLYGDWCFEYEKKRIILQEFIVGDEYSRKNVPENLFLRTVAMLGKINASLENYKMKPRKDLSVSYCEEYDAGDVVKRLEKSLARLNAADIGEKELGEISTAVQYLQKVQPSIKKYGSLFKYLTHSSTHGDYHVDNLIYEEDEIVAIVDWTSSGYMPVGFNLMVLGLDFCMEDIGINSTDFSGFIKSLHEYTAYAPLTYYDYKLMPYAYLLFWGRTAALARVERYVNHRLADNDELAKRKLKMVLRAIRICKYLEQNADIISCQLEKYYEQTLSKDELKQHKKWLKDQSYLKWLYRQESAARRSRALRRVAPLAARKAGKRILLLGRRG